MPEFMAVEPPELKLSMAAWMRERRVVGVGSSTFSTRPA
jgi:hypothetical protein